MFEVPLHKNQNWDVPDAMKKKNLRLAVKNFGPIREGEVEFKPLTVFIGPNNSGKSYMATLLYALTQALTGSVGTGYGALFSTADMQAFYSDELSDTDSKALNEWRQIVSDISTDPDTKLISKVQPAFRKILDNGVERIEEDIQKALQDYFGSYRLIDLISHGYGQPGKFSIDLLGHNNYEAFVNIRESGDKSYYKINSQQIIPGPVATEILRVIPRRIHPYTSLNMSLLWQRGLAYLGVPEGRVIYLPAGRSGLVHVWQLTASIAVGMLGWHTGGRDFEMPAFSAVARDFTQQLINLRPMVQDTEHTNPFSHAITLLEDEILHGTVKIRMSKNIPTMSYEADAFRLPIQRVSSMISELAPIHLWMGHLLEEGDTLIIDEPEAHLHPENQRFIAQVLVRLMNAGVRVVCATHSSLILHQMSNQILATASGKLDKVGFTEHDKLNLEDIGVYLFDLAEDGARISEVEVDTDFGISEDEFVRVADQIGDETYQLVT